MKLKCLICLEDWGSGYVHSNKFCIMSSTGPIDAVDINGFLFYTNLIKHGFIFANLFDSVKALYEERPNLYGCVYLKGHTQYGK